MADDAREGDGERPILDAGSNEYPRQLVNDAVPRADREASVIDFAFREPFAAAIRTSGLFEWAATDRERICHDANPF